MTTANTVNDAGEAAALAGKLMGCDPTVMVTGEIPGGLGWFVSRGVRGGGTVMVAPDGSVLFLPSSYQGDAAAAFRGGERTPLEAFPGGA